MQKTKRFTKKEWSWIMYDWANSIYATNIMAAIYPTIFASMFDKGDIMWGYGTSVATFIVAILAPFLGAIADHKGMKKVLFTIFALAGIVFTPLMAFFGNMKLCLVGYVLSRIGFSGSCLFYDSFLTDVTTNNRMDKVSSWGYAMGYIGGSTIPFIISIAILLVCGFESRFAQVFSVLIVSAWWVVFSIPFWKNVKQEHYLENAEAFNPKKILMNVWKTFRDICTHKGLFIFIIAYFFYIDGVGTIISISTAYGTALGLGTVGMIIALLITQIVAMPCSILFARISAKTGARKSLICAIAVYIVICMVGFIMGYTLEPHQETYESMVDSAAAPVIEVLDAEEKETALAFVKDAKTALKTEDAAGEMALLLENEKYAGETFIALSDTLLTAAKENQSAVDNFNSAISFSSLLFWSMAVLVGTVQGGIQAVSRSYFGKLVPKDRSNEYFGFFDIFGKFAAVIGPFLYSTVATVTGRSSYGVLGLMALFFIGLFMLVYGRKHLDALTD